MRKLILLVFSALCISSNAQVFNTASTLKPGTIMLGFEPTYMINPDQFMMFFHGGYGLTKGIDFSLHGGVGGNSSYFGGDIEWALMRHVSLTTGAHHFGDFGLDGTLNLTFPIRHDSRVYTGFDMDLNFGNKVTAPMWIPLGVEIGLRNHLAFLFEAEISVTNDYHVLGGGLVFYFR
jgi:hypothetical protein